MRDSKRRALAMFATATTAAAVTLTACHSAQSGHAVSAPGLSGVLENEKALANAVTYAFDSLDERRVSSTAHRGKPTVLAFIATGDLSGQAQVDYLVAMAKNDGTNVNYALVALHPRKEIPIVEAYLAALHVDFPAALSDAQVLAASGPFGEMPAVPTLVVLDSRGHVVWKYTGLAKPDAIRAHLPRR